jgi:HD-GYP domain-containing protein (c-di-GMP phosphodiesterase class II)
LELNIPITDIILSISSAIDLIDPIKSNHHKRVAYISYCIAKEMNLNDNDIKNLVLASLLHDCGAINLSEKNSSFEITFGNSIIQRHTHGRKGWLILRDLTDLRDAAEIIKFHHVYWSERLDTHLKTYEIPTSCYILHLAERIDILINHNHEILSQRRNIEDIVNANSGRMFMPEAVEAFNNLLPKQYFWFDIVSPYLDNVIKQILLPYNTYINNDGLHQYAKIIHRIIDFRSSYTATHSIGVATCASVLASNLGFNASDTKIIHSAGLIHDMGMLNIPKDILEKPGTLDLAEYNIVKSHTYHTYMILSSIPGLERVRDWASFHHEKLDGSGYPFGLKSDQLDLGSRILAVSDLFTSLTEERSYRHSLSIDTAMEIINVSKNLDTDVKLCLNKNLKEIVEKITISKDDVSKNCEEIFNLP